MTSSGAVTRPDGGFVDALSGADGTADTPSLLWARELFPDALAEPEADALPARTIAAATDLLAARAMPATAARTASPKQRTRSTSQRTSGQSVPAASSYVVPTSAQTSAA